MKTYSSLMLFLFATLSFSSVSAMERGSGDEEETGIDNKQVAVQAVVAYVNNPQDAHTLPESITRVILATKSTSQRQGKREGIQEGVQETADGVLEQLNYNFGEKASRCKKCPDTVYKRLEALRNQNAFLLQTGQNNLQQVVLKQLDRQERVDDIPDDFFTAIQTAKNTAREEGKQEAQRKGTKKGGIFTKSNLLSGGTGGTIIALAWLGKSLWNR